MHVACVGDLMIDVLAQVSGPLAIGSDTPAPITFGGGGAAANVAAWLVAAGGTATFVGRIGEDVAGRAAVDTLHAAGVQTAVTVDPHSPTGSCIVLIGPDAQRTMIPSAGANAGALDHADLPADADVLYLSGYSIFATPGRPRVLEQARERGLTIAVDAASAAPLAQFGAERFFAVLGADVLVFANTDEARVLSAEHDPRAAVRLIARRTGAAIVKCGADGAMWSDGTEVARTPAVAVQVVDTTGAGDAFAAGYLAALRSGGAVVPTVALAAGAGLAAQAVAQLGARPRIS